jgi:hypothetical protein
MKNMDEILIGKSTAKISGLLASSEASSSRSVNISLASLFKRLSLSNSNDQHQHRSSHDHAVWLMYLRYLCTDPSSPLARWAVAVLLHVLSSNNSHSTANSAQPTQISLSAPTMLPRLLQLAMDFNQLMQQSKASASGRWNEFQHLRSLLQYWIRAACNHTTSISMAPPLPVEILSELLSIIESSLGFGVQNHSAGNTGTGVNSQQVKPSSKVLMKIAGFDSSVFARRPARTSAAKGSM